MSLSGNNLLKYKRTLLLVAVAIILVGVSITYVLLRSSEASGEGEGRVKLIAPRDGATIQSMHPRFRWMKIPGSTAYQFSLCELNRTPVWSALVRDTSLVIPSSVALVPGQTYLWHVDAILSGENTEHSELQAFTLSQ